MSRWIGPPVQGRDLVAGIDGLVESARSTHALHEEEAVLGIGRRPKQVIEAVSIPVTDGEGAPEESGFLRRHEVVSQKC
jgi:hypothetical protein